MWDEERNVRVDGMKTTTKILPPVINQQVKAVSKKFGVREQDIFKNAVSFYLDNIVPYLELKHELATWDELSDEALIKFERTLAHETG